MGVDLIDESEVLTPVDEQHHINKWLFTVPFVNGCRELCEALRRISEGASMIRSKGEAGTGGNVSEAVKHFKVLYKAINELYAAYRDGDEERLRDFARQCQVCGFVLPVGPGRGVIDSLGSSLPLLLPSSSFPYPR